MGTSHVFRDNKLSWIALYIMGSFLLFKIVSYVEREDVGLFAKTMKVEECENPGTDFPTKNLQSFGVYSDDEFVMVLGSGGLVGRYLTKELRSRGHRVLEVKGREHLDLRERGALDIFAKVKIKFAFFLACEVGGAKFIFDENSQRRIWDYNIDMYNVVFPFLREKNIKFLFATTSLIEKNITYAKMKKYGEDEIAKMPNGKSFRIWNAFGMEPIGKKSHVVSDWITSCMKNGRIESMTDGTELRQYMYGGDMARQLVIYMDNFDEIDKVMPATTWLWSDLKEIAHAVTEVLRPRYNCSVRFSQKAPAISKVVDPPINNKDGMKVYYLKHPLSLQEGIRETAFEYEERNKKLEESEDVPYLSVIVREDGIGIGLRQWTDKMWEYSKMYGLSVQILLAMDGAIDVEFVPDDADIFMIDTIENTPTMSTLINVAMRDVKGEYLMVCGSEVKMSESLIENIAKRNLRKNAYYLAEIAPQHGVDIRHQHKPFRRVSHRWTNCTGTEDSSISDRFILSHRSNFESIGGFPDGDYPILNGELRTRLDIELPTRMPGMDRIVFEQMVTQIRMREI